MNAHRYALTIAPEESYCIRMSIEELGMPSSQATLQPIKPWRGSNGKACRYTARLGAGLGFCPFFAFSLRLFSLVERHVLLVGEQVARIFEPELTDLQKQVLRLLQVPEAVYWSQNASQ